MVGTGVDLKGWQNWRWDPGRTGNCWGSLAPKWSLQASFFPSMRTSIQWDRPGVFGFGLVWVVICIYIDICKYKCKYIYICECTTTYPTTWLHRICFFGCGMLNNHSRIRIWQTFLVLKDCGVGQHLLRWAMVASYFPTAAIESGLICPTLWETLGCGGSQSNHPTQRWSQHHPHHPICLDDQDKNSLQGRNCFSCVWRFENFSCTTKFSSTMKCTFWHMVGPCTFLYSSAVL